MTYLSFHKAFRYFAFTFSLMALTLVSCNNHHDPGEGNDADHDIIYIQTNDFNNNQNAVLAYRHNPSGGGLEQISGSPFFTNGSGLGNPMQILGPADSDFELVKSSDGKYLLAVNSGSNSIAVFAIHSDGSLSHVPGSPFSSQGETPVSIAVRGDHVYVVNKSQNPLHATSSAPNYAVFTIDGAGALTPLAGENAIFQTAPGSSPTQVLVSKTGEYVFGDDFLGFMLSPAAGTLRSFAANDGLLPLPGTPYTLPLGPMPPDNGALGLYLHPSGDVLYSGIPAQGKVGVFSVNNNTGALSLQNTVMAGKAACWIRTNQSGNRMYVLNSGENTVQVFNTSDALHPQSLQTLLLKNSGPDYTNMAGTFKTSQPFSLVLSSNEKKLYIVNQHTNTDFSIGNFNYLHSLEVATDGTLSEPGEPLQIPVPNTVRPKGSLVVKR